LFTNHFPVNTFELDLFSGACLNKLVFLWWPLIEDNSVSVADQVRCFLVWKRKHSRLPKRRASFRN